eukprot:1233789-Prymnesium_polylepis.1
MRVHQVDDILVDATLPVANFVDPKSKSSDVVHVTLTASLQEHPNTALTEQVEKQLAAKQHSSVGQGAQLPSGGTETAGVELQLEESPVDTASHAALDFVYGKKSAEELKQWMLVAAKVIEKCEPQLREPARSELTSEQVVELEA